MFDLKVGGCGVESDHVTRPRSSSGLSSYHVDRTRGRGIAFAEARRYRGKGRVLPGHTDNKRTEIGYT